MISSQLDESNTTTLLYFYFYLLDLNTNLQFVSLISLEINLEISIQT